MDPLTPLARLQSAPTKHPKLRVGQLTKDWKSMHLLEAALRSEARQSGRYITAYSQRYGAAFKCSLFFACVLSDRCDFYIKFVPGEQKDGAGWICKELCTVHSCSSIAPAISRILDQSLSFWVSSIIPTSQHHMDAEELFGSPLLRSKVTTAKQRIDKLGVTTPFVPASLRYTRSLC